jgi:hypothetical protein
MAHLQLIDHDPVQTPRQARGAFLFPLQRVDVAAARTEGLECVRIHRRQIMLQALRLSELSDLRVHDKIGGLGVRISAIFGTSMVGDSNNPFAGDIR